MPDSQITVAVLGGDEYYGSALVRGLSSPAYSAAFRVVALPSSAADNCAADPATFLAQIAGVHTVICAGRSPYESEGGRREGQWSALLTACQRARVKRVVPSPFAFDIEASRKLAPSFPFIQRRLDEYEALQQSELEYTIVSCGLLTELLLSPAAGVDLERGVVTAPCRLSQTIATTTLDDLARLLPEVLLSRSAVNATDVRLASASVTYTELASLLQAATGRRFQCEWKQDAAEQAGDSTTRLLAAVLASGKGCHWSKGESWNAIRVPHIRTTAVPDWIGQHVPAAAPHPAAVAPPPLNMHPSADACSHAFTHQQPFPAAVLTAVPR